MIQNNYSGFCFQREGLSKISRNMMTSSNGNIFRVTGQLCGEFTGHRWIHHTKASDSGALMFLICTWINGWVNNREASDLRRHRVHYDVIVMKYQNLRRVLNCGMQLLGPLCLWSTCTRWDHFLVSDNAFWQKSLYSTKREDVNTDIDTSNFM